MPFEVNGSCARCGRPFRLNISGSPEADVHCTACGEQIVRRIVGYLYVLSNPEMPGLLKIGQTTRPVVERVAELNSATGVPCPFAVEAWFESTDPQLHEAEVHKLLSVSRVLNREFFRVSVNEAVSAVRRITGADPNGTAPLHVLLPPSPSANRPSIFRRWRCDKCSKEFKAVKGMCCDQQATLIA